MKNIYKIFTLIIIILLTGSFFQDVGAATPACLPTQGCTGTTTSPTANQVLVGNSAGRYDYMTANSANGFPRLDSNGNLIGTMIIGTSTAANLSGTVLQQGEPRFTSDTKQLFVGDDVTSGGISTGVFTKNTDGSIYYKPGGRDFLGIGTTSPYCSLSIATTTSTSICLGDLNDGIGDHYPLLEGNALGSDITALSGSEFVVERPGLGLISSGPSLSLLSANFLKEGDMILDTSTNQLIFQVAGANPSVNFAISKFGISSSTPGTMLSIGSSGGINLIPTATSTFGTSAGGINVLHGCFAVNGVCLQSGADGLGTSTNPFIATYFVATSSTEGFQKAWGASGGYSYIVHAPFVDGSQYDDGLRQNTDQREVNVFSKAADGTSKVTFSTGSTPTERMRISDAGLVGIGTTTPYVPLDVSGSMRVGGVSTCTFPSAGQGFEECYNSSGTGLDGVSSGISLFQSFNRDNSTWKDVSIRGKEIDLELSGNQRMYLSGSADSFYLNGGAVGMIINSTGVGFGASPASPLDGQGTPSIDGATRQVERLIDNTSFAKDVGADIAFWGKFSSGGSSGNLASIGGHKENATDGDYASYLNFITRVFGGSPTERMRITSTGNVGIGTTTPTANLQVTASAVNATTSVQFGKKGQNKGSCLTYYDAAGSPVYAYIAAGATAFTLTTTQPSGCQN